MQILDGGGGHGGFSVHLAHHVGRILVSLVHVLQISTTDLLDLLGLGLLALLISQFPDVPALPLPLVIGLSRIFLHSYCTLDKYKCERGYIIVHCLHNIHQSCITPHTHTFLNPQNSYFQIFKMSKQTPVRNWKYVHHNRKQSEDSMDNSVDSVQSSKSGKFNRFQFTRKEEKSPLPLPFQRDSREPIFVFTGKSRDKNHDRSLLSKHSAKEKDSDTSKLSENEPILKGITSAALKTDRELLFKQGETPREGRSEAEGKSELMILHAEAFHGSSVKDVLRQVRGITEEFRKVIALFTKKYREMRFEWDRSFKQLLSLQVTQETQAIHDLKAQLERKQEELEQLSRISFQKHAFAATAGSAVKPAEGNRGIINGNSSFDRLAISKVEHPREVEPLSRTNTIADFLNTQAMRDREDRPPGLQLRNLRQTIKRMHQILEE